MFTTISVISLAGDCIQVLSNKSDYFHIVFTLTPNIRYWLKNLLNFSALPLCDLFYSSEQYLPGRARRIRINNVVIDIL